MKTFKHIVNTRFDVHDATRFDKEWLKYRFEIFKKYTLQSLLNQDTQNFALLIRYVSDFKEEAKEFNDYLKTLSIPCFFTYCKNGIDYETEEIDEYLKESDYVIDTRIDSDDMYHKSVLSDIQKQKDIVDKIFIFVNGYLYRESTDSLYVYHGSSAPFYTCVYPTKVYLNQKLRKEYYPFLPEPSQYKNKIYMPDNKYLVIVHGKNSTRYTWDWVKNGNLESGSFSKVKEEDKIIKNKYEILNNFKIWTK